MTKTIESAFEDNIHIGPYVPTQTEEHRGEGRRSILYKVKHTRYT